jgi:2-polyprenyl-6-hydroxyphenyl methylase/3-demethylubiquinone-9 3-methyltransferase
MIRVDRESTDMSSHAVEIAKSERFEFGKNWNRFLSNINESAIQTAEASLLQMLEVENLAGKSFLDIGSGSGLFSLAARRLGARVHSMDYDPQSVACTAELKRRYFANDESWVVEEESALNREYLLTLGTFDIVYSWGVLHHTGEMWKALENASLPVAQGGKMFIAIYNNTGSQTTRWKWIKRTYNKLPRVLRAPFTLVVTAPDEAKSLLRSLVTLKPGQYVRTWTQYSEARGMSHWRDIVDWVGGYPYEVAYPEEILDFYRARGFTLTRLKCGGVGLGCNEFVFVRDGGGTP